MSHTERGRVVSFEDLEVFQRSYKLSLAVHRKVNGSRVFRMPAKGERERAWRYRK